MKKKNLCGSSQKKKAYCEEAAGCGFSEIQAELFNWGE